MSVSNDPIRGGASLRSVRSEAWLTPDEIQSPLVVFVHGFTADENYFDSLATYILRHGFDCAVLEYNSYLGIDVASRHLTERLSRLADHLSRFGLVVVGHSMGGLVARHFAMNAPASIAAHLAGIVTIGTPHRGTIDGLTISILLDLGESLSGKVNPFGRSAFCRSARQLTLADEDRLLESMLAEEDQKGSAAQILSISGGLNYIEVGTPHFSGPLSEVGNLASSLIGRKTNRYLQRRLSRPNDGLVEERSSNIVVTRQARRENLTHRGDGSYSSWALTNHTYLVKNQAVGDVIIDFLRDRAVFGRTHKPR